jgi:tryptophanyl-tRNA synthetase
MAADILVYRGTHVPVGDDQKQHLELARDIAMKFNLDYAEHIRKAGYGIDITVGNEPVHAYFPMVEPLIDGPAPRVMSLRDGTKKMSKSDPSDLSRINLMDDEETISKKIRKAKTDPDGLPSEIDGLKGRPEADNLVGIYAALADKSRTEVLAEFGGQQFSVFKPALIELAVNVLSPITSEMRRLMADTSHIDAILRDGGARARARAEVTMKEVRDIVGFLY